MSTENPYWRPLPEYVKKQIAEEAAARLAHENGTWTPPEGEEEGYEGAYEYDDPESAALLKRVEAWLENRPRDDMSDDLLKAVILAWKSVE